MTRTRWLVFIAILAAVVVFIACGPDEAAIIRESAAWRAFAREHLLTSLAIFLAAEVAVVAMSIPVGIWMTFLAGYLFGIWVGAAVVAVGATSGAVVAFLAARYVFADWLHRVARKRFARVLAATDRGLSEHGTYFVLLLRLTPVFPFWVLNLALGLTRVHLRDYAWATLIGILPMVLVVANAGASLAEVTTLREILSPRVFLAMCLLPLAAFVLHRLVKLPRAMEERSF